MRTNLLVAYSCMVMLILGCKKIEDLNNKIPFINEKITKLKIEVARRSNNAYSLYFDNDHHGSVTVSATRNINGNIEGGNYVFRLLSVFSKKRLSEIYSSGSYISVGNSITIGALTISKNSRNAYSISELDSHNSSISSLFGESIGVNTAGNLKENYNAINSSFYIPKLLNVSMGGDFNSLPNGGYSTSVGDVLKVNWDEDTENDNGVIISVRPQFYLNDDNIPDPSTNIPNPPQTVIVTNDDGSYTFTPDDFDGFPKNTSLLITVARGNIQLIDESKKTKLMGYDVTFVHSFALVQ